MHFSTICRVLSLAAAMTAQLAAQGRGRPGPTVPTLPDGQGKDAVLRACGSSCHGPQIVAGKGYSRQNWATVVNGMIARGAKVEANEVGEIVDYLAKNLPPRTGTAGAGGAGFIGAGPDDAHIVDLDAAKRGQATYVAECVTCHGNRGRGGAESLPPAQRGSDLVRSMVVLSDRYGAGIGAFLKNGHPMQSGKASASIQGATLIDLAHFLHLKVNDTLRSGPFSQPVNVLTGNAQAGQAYFNGAGGCTKCHSVTGDLAGIGKKYDPVTLQQKFLFPRSFGFSRGGGAMTPPKPTMATVTANGKSVKGVLVHLDDFHVAVKDAAGDHQSWARSAAVKVTVEDPYAEHIALLDKYSDKNIHDVVRYLEGLK